MRRSGVQSLRPLVRADARDRSLEWKLKGSRVEVRLPARRKNAAGAGETTSAARHDRGPYIIEDSRGCRRDQVPEEMARDGVAVGRHPVEGARVASVAVVRGKIRDPGEVSQMSRGSVIGDEEIKNATASARHGRTWVRGYFS